MSEHVTVVLDADLIPIKEHCCWIAAFIARASVVFQRYETPALLAIAAGACVWFGAMVARAG